MDNNIFSGEYKIIEGTDISKIDRDLDKGVELDTKKYPIAKPKRKIIKAKIIHD
jgi:hypothetical protein